MICPVCDRPLAAFDLEGVQIDRCLDCRGTWLDAGELEILAGNRKFAGTPGPKHDKRRCPRCGAKLRRYKIEAVEVDECPRGHGLWFDKGEMETLVASSKEGGVARFFGELYKAERKEGE
jgi:Zn-finger nucleic acid-binding protein